MKGRINDLGLVIMVFWITKITQKRPMKTILINDKSIVGLLDTGADVSCISGKDWPSSWPTYTTEKELEKVVCRIKML